MVSSSTPMACWSVLFNKDIYSMKDSKGYDVLVTSSSKTSSLSSSTSKPSKMRPFVPCISVRAVATTGRFVVLRRRRVNSNPMPREAGVVRIQGRDMVHSVKEETDNLRMMTCSARGHGEVAIDIP